MTARLLTNLFTVTLLALAQTVSGPDPREIPIPPIDAPLGKLPSVDELPLRTAMPDVLTMDNGNPSSPRNPPMNS